MSLIWMGWILPALKEEQIIWTPGLGRSVNFVGLGLQGKIKTTYPKKLKHIKIILQSSYSIALKDTQL